MKIKILFLSVISFVAVSSLKAQGPYAGFGIGYGLPFPATVLGNNSSSNSAGNSFSIENVRGSYGSGLNFGVYVGDMISEQVGFELGINYLMGHKYMFENDDATPPGSDNISDEMFARSLRLTPSLRVGFGTGTIRGYMRGGFAIGVMNTVTDNTTETATSPGATDVWVESFVYRGGISFGFSGALGMQIPISDNMSFFAEASDYFVNWSPKEGELTESTLNGSDQLGSMTTDQKQYEFVDEVNQSMNTSSSQPTQQLKFYFPMSSFGLNIGLHFAF
jgi:hypothetical protein